MTDSYSVTIRAIMESFLSFFLRTDAYCEGVYYNIYASWDFKITSLESERSASPAGCSSLAKICQICRKLFKDLFPYHEVNKLKKFS